MQVTADKLVRDVRVVVDDAEDLIKATAGDVEEKTREARAKLAGALAVAKETLNRAERKTSESARAVDAFIRNYPYPCLGAALAIGLLVGVLVSRR